MIKCDVCPMQSAFSDWLPAGHGYWVFKCLWQTTETRIDGLLFIWRWRASHEKSQQADSWYSDIHLLRKIHHG